MYNPPHFKEDRVPVLHDAMRQAGLATLVTFGVDGLDRMPRFVRRSTTPLGPDLLSLFDVQPEGHT